MSKSSTHNQDMAKTLVAKLNKQSELCDNLEKFADSLPSRFNVQDCLILAKSIIPIIKNSHEFEEAILFPALLTQYNQNNQLASTVERLQFEHWEDESFAGELRESLIGLANHSSAASINSLSYMLRGFFEGLRRHIAFEREHIIPIIASM